MRTKGLSLGLALGAALALGGGSLAAWTLAGGANPAEQAPRTAGGVLRVLYAQPFVLEHGYRFDWRRERPTLEAGWLLVLEVDPRRVVPRQELEPVLYVGDATAERVNHGADSGRVVAIVPARRGATGGPELDLASTPMWFGTPALPEQVDAATVRAEAELARRAGIRAPPSEELATARQAGGSLARFEDRTELARHAARVLWTWSPADRELAEGMLAPPVK